METDDTAITLSEYQSNGLFLFLFLFLPFFLPHLPFSSPFPSFRIPSLSYRHKRYLYGAAHDHVALGNCWVATGFIDRLLNTENFGYIDTGGDWQKCHCSRL